MYALSSVCKSCLELLLSACSNQFLNQEPGSNAAIKDFAQQKGFSGLLMDKIDVNGSQASPVYTYLKVMPTAQLVAT